MSGLWIGTSGWTYDGWRGPFYPEDMAKKIGWRGMRRDLRRRRSTARFIGRRRWKRCSALARADAG